MMHHICQETCQLPQLILSADCRPLADNTSSIKAVRVARLASTAVRQRED